MTSSIGYKGITQIQPLVDVSQNSGQQILLRQRAAWPVNLLPGQTFIIPNGSWLVSPGRYTLLQWFDTNGARWRNFTAQPGQSLNVESDGQNYRIANLTGCPIGALITNVGNGNVTNGYQSITVTPSAGNSTWGVLHGGSVNNNCNVVAGGNYALPPLLLWSPAANQTIPFVAPQFNCTMSGNAISTVGVVDQGAGLTGVGTITVVQQPGDTNPGGGSVIVAGNNLINSGNMTALWPLTPGQNGNTGLAAVPTLTFGAPSSAAATVIMNLCVTGAIGTANVGANYGAAGSLFTIIAANAIQGTAAVSIGGAGNANAQVANSVNDYESWPARNCWLTSNTNALAQASNANIQVVDAGFGFQAIPILTVIPANANSAMQNIGAAVFTASVSGVQDTTFLQSMA
jgi:hypothetical protein